MKSSNFIFTISPSNNSAERIERMLYRGMSIARLNMSHGSFDQHAESIKNIRLAAESFHKRTKFHCSLAVAVDLRGPEIRTGKVDEPQGKRLKLGDFIKLNENSQFADKTLPDTIHIDCPIAGKAKKNLEIFIDDGAIALNVEDIFGDIVTCRVTRGGVLRSNRTVFIPKIARELNLPIVSENDKLDIEFALKHDVDFIFASHVECSDLIDEIRGCLGDAGDGIKVYAKIQNHYGVDDIEEIVSKSDGIVIAPTMDFKSVTIPFIQRLILKICKKKMKPCLMTVELEMDAIGIYEVVNWQLNNGDGAIITNEASQGKENPLESMKVLQNIQSIITEPTNVIEKILIEPPFSVDVSFALTWACVISSINTNASVIILITDSEHLAHLVHFHQPKCPMIAVMKNQKVARQMNILNNTIPLVYEEDISEDSKMNYAIEFSKKRGLVKCGDTVIVLKSSRNVMEIHYIPYDDK